MSPAAFGIAFERVAGSGAVARIVDSFTDTPVLLLAGDQVSGKSTAAKLLADRLGGTAGSTGALVRMRAAELGLTFDAYNARLRHDPEVDVRHDHLAASAIAAGRVVVFESRLAGHLGSWLRALGRTELHSVYLHCPPIERALRVLERATSAAVRERVARTLDDVPDATFEQIVRRLAASPEPGVLGVAEQLRFAAARDANDQARIRAIYGVDYTDISVFDARIDTSRGSPAATADAIIHAWRSAGGRS
jgi:cytidylate kinase